MRLLVTSVLSLASLSLAAVPVLADDATAPTLPPLVFPTLGADGLDSSLDARIGIVAANEVDRSLFHLQVGGQLVGASGWGGYGRIAATVADGGSESGSPELGVLKRAGDVTVRVGAIVPVGRDDANGRANFRDTAATRPSDILTSVQAGTLRAAVAASTQRGNLVLRFDGGLDLAALTGDDGLVLVHVDAGAGVRRGRLAAVVELSNVIAISEADPVRGHGLAISLEHTGDAATTFVTISETWWSDDGALGGDAILLGVRGGV